MAELAIELVFESVVLESLVLESLEGVVVIKSLWRNLKSDFSTAFTSIYGMLHLITTEFDNLMHGQVRKVRAASLVLTSS